MTIWINPAYAPAILLAIIAIAMWAGFLLAREIELRRTLKAKKG